MEGLHGARWDERNAQAWVYEAVVDIRCSAGGPLKESDSVFLLACSLVCNAFYSSERSGEFFFFLNKRKTACCSNRVKSGASFGTSKWQKKDLRLSNRPLNILKILFGLSAAEEVSFTESTNTTMSNYYFKKSFIQNSI